MLNLNGLKIITGCMLSGDATVTLANGGGNAPLGTSITKLFSGINIVRRTAYSSLSDSGSTGLYFCSKAHPATINDFDFADKNDILNVGGSGSTPAIEYFDDHLDIFTALTLENYESHDVVISEVYYAKFWNNGYSYLIDHTVLDKPITLPANGIKSLTYTIRINF